MGGRGGGGEDGYSEIQNPYPWRRKGGSYIFRHPWWGEGGQNSVFIKTNMSASPPPPTPYYSYIFSVSILSDLETTLLPFLNQG